MMGPDVILRREDSIEDKPAGRPSSPPVCLSALAITGGVAELVPAPGT